MDKLHLDRNTEVGISPKAAFVPSGKQRGAVSWPN